MLYIILSNKIALTVILLASILYFILKNKNKVEPLSFIVIKNKKIRNLIKNEIKESKEKFPLETEEQQKIRATDALYHFYRKVLTYSDPKEVYDESKSIINNLWHSF